jgi:peptide/nickel transport system substrate-binding protein
VSDHWDRVNRRALSRRAVLKGGATGLLGLVVAGCATTAAPAPTPAPAAPATTAPGPGQPAAAATAAPSPTAQAKRGGTFTYFTSANEFAHLDPHQLGFIPFFDNMHSFNRVLRYRVDVDPAGLVPTGDLAESWEQADDTTYLFKLRKGVKFHNVAPANGRELTAQDIIWSFQRQIGEKLNASYLGGLQKFEAVDNSTLKVTTPKPDADFLATFADFHNVILNKESVEQKGDIKEGPLIGTGPFVFEKWDKNAVMTFVRNPDYFDKSLPYTDRVEIFRIADPAAMEAAFRARRIVLLQASGSVTRDMTTRIKAQTPEAQEFTVRQPQSGVELSLNTQSGPTKDLRVRQAINKAIDRTAFRDTLYFGDGWMTSDLRLPAVEWNLPDDELKKGYWTRDLEGAKKLLADAGFANGFDMEIETLNLPTFTPAAELLVAQLKDAGIRATIHLHEAAVDRDLKFNLKYQNLHLSGVSPEPSLNSELYGRYYTKGPRNSTGYSDPELDKLIDQQAVMSRDPEGRKKLVQDIQRRIMDRSGMIMPNPLINLGLTWRNVKALWPAINSEPYRMAVVWLDS